MSRRRGNGSALLLLGGAALAAWYLWRQRASGSGGGADLAAWNGWLAQARPWLEANALFDCRLLRVEPATFPDSCLGRPRPGEVCAQGLRRGYLVDLRCAHRFAPKDPLLRIPGWVKEVFVTLAVDAETGDTRVWLIDVGPRPAGAGG